MERRLVVVSNRLPLTLRRTGGAWTAEPSAGGLTTAFAPVLQRTGGAWIGWPGEAPGNEQGGRGAVGEELQRWQAERGYVPVDLPQDLGSRFYHGFANQALWPLFHQFPDHVVYDAAAWPAYVEANERFRDAVLARVGRDDLVWVHDYHLMLLPALLREARPDLAIGFFLHIPFPGSDLFRILPGREELLSGLLGADLVGFHTHADVQHFRASLQRVLGIPSQMDRVAVGGRNVRIEARPIGIAPDELSRLLAGRRGRSAARKLEQRRPAARLLLAVDRLDYTKGIPERLRSFRRLLEEAPELRERLALVQVAVPSRERIPRYRELRSRVNALVGEINGSFSTPGWTPVVYLQRSLPRAELVALYAAADLAWVAPLRDGMNLVAKEYVACQEGKAGVLVLSEFAGAAAEMGEAVIVNPYDEQRTASAVRRALAMPEDERRERMGALLARVRRDDVFAWAGRFLDSLADAAGERRTGAAGEPLPLPEPELLDAFRAARSGVLMIDYDGTLVPFSARPDDALPPPGLVSTVERLAADPRLRVAIVSGRPRRFLERVFGGSSALWLAAEHGALLRPPGSREWQPLRDFSPEWKERVRPVLEHFVLRTPGSAVEEKEYALVWHFRTVEPEFGEWLANQLAHDLSGILAGTELVAVRGSKIIEVKPGWATKGEVVKQLEAAGAAPEIRLAIGDDATDEDLFEALPASAWTVHVGGGESRARFCLRTPQAVRRLLEKLAGEP